ncbi:zinc finger protein, putative [Plasmodium vivax]|uniref:Zinc finger protein, putative n=1 Tax=Plasmodium vivax TaxID=5855 RepID=A0A564ZVW5_PLAVI|nr:zinc finger protein, putative [Plasmodium vivax]
MSKKNQKKKKSKGRKRENNSSSNVCGKHDDEVNEEKAADRGGGLGINGPSEDSPAAVISQVSDTLKREKERGGSAPTGEIAEKGRNPTSGDEADGEKDKKGNTLHGVTDMAKGKTMDNAKSTKRRKKKSAAAPNIPNEGAIESGKVKSVNDDVDDIPMPSGDQGAEEQTSSLFPNIDVDAMYSLLAEKAEDQNEFLRDLNKEIEKFKKKFNDANALSSVRRDRHNFSSNYSIKKEGEKRGAQQRIVIGEAASGTNNNTGSYHPIDKCNGRPRCALSEKENYNFYEMLLKGQPFLRLKRKIKKKKKKKIKMRTKHYQVVSDLCGMRTEGGTPSKTKRRYYIFNYNCGNTKIQSITGYIRCFKGYCLYRGNSTNSATASGTNSSLRSSLHSSLRSNLRSSLRGSHQRSHHRGHHHNSVNGSHDSYNLKRKLSEGRYTPGEVAISVLLCANVSNCLSPSEFLELLHPFDNFIFFLKVLNKKNNEEYMIYFLTFDVYAKRIMKKVKRISFFNMKKKKRLKVYIVKDITMNATSRIKKNTQRMVRVNTFYEEGAEGDTSGRVTGKAIQNGEQGLPHPHENIHPPHRSRFINPLYLISQNKLQLSCAVCLEPLYSDSLSKVISHIFNLNFGTQKGREPKARDPPPPNQGRGSGDGDGDGDGSGVVIPTANTGAALFGETYYGEDEPSRKVSRSNSNSNGNSNSSSSSRSSCSSRSCQSSRHRNGRPYETKARGKQTKKRQYCVKTLSSYAAEDRRSYYLSVTSFIHSIQKEYYNQVKKKKKKKERKTIFNNVCINILCGHIFHSSCLKKCCFTSCPICRYKQYNYQIANCDVCEKNQNAKICLFCGFIGCSVNYDRLNKLKEMKLKEKKKLLRRKKKLIAHIRYTFLRIVNFFIKGDYTVASPFVDAGADRQRVCGQSMEQASKINNMSEHICSAIFQRGGNTLLDVDAKCASVNGKGVSNQLAVPIEGAPDEGEKENKNNDPHPSSTKNGVNPQLQIHSVSGKTANFEVHLCAEKKIVVEGLDFSTELTACGRSRVNLARHGSFSSFLRFRKMMRMDRKKGKGTNRGWRHKRGENKMGAGKTNQVNARHEKKRHKGSATGVSRRRGRLEWSGRAKREGDSFNKYDLVKRDMNTRKDSIERRKKKKLVDHAKDHFCETMHNYFFDISKNSVFDYSSNLYIKKLINLKSGKKNLKKIYSANINMNGKEEIIDKKNIIMYIYEFNQLLSALLESQRDHFMSCIYELKLNYENVNRENSREASKCLSELRVAQERNKQLKAQVKKKISILQEKAKTNAQLLQQLRNVEIVNAKLCEGQKQEIHNQEALAEEKRKMIREKQQVIRELNQQITDLTFHKQAAAKFSQNSGMTNSSFIIGEKMAPKSRFKKR